MKQWAMVLTTAIMGTGLAACGDDEGKGHLADAPLGVQDAEPADATQAIQPVTVTVTSNGSPASGLTVYFQNADSSLVSDTKTGDDGKASAVMAAGGFVTVIESVMTQSGSGSGNGPTQLATFAGVKPGDNLHDDLGGMATEIASITFDVSVPNEQVGNEYLLYSTCGGRISLGQGTGPVASARGLHSRVAVAEPVTNTVTLSGCNGTADLLVLSQDGDHVTTGWQYKSDVAVADGMAISLTADYQPPVDTTFDYTKVPDTISGLMVSRELHTAHGSLYLGDSVFTDLNGTEATATIAMPAPPGVSMLTTSTDQPTSGNGQQTFLAWGPATASYALPYGDVALEGYATRPRLDAASHAITWTANPGVAADLVLGGYNSSRSDDQEVFHSWNWRIVAPYSAAQAALSFPVLPTTVFDFNPKDTDSPSVQRLTTAKVPGGYDAVRSVVFDTDIGVTITGASGQTIYEDMYQRPDVVISAKVKPASKIKSKAAHPARRSSAPKHFTLPAR
jgi:hypothetical protein